ncbi:MAG: hypothetical protein JWM65_446, partial [Sphingomonas bacterium]|nr:hypothetical protein [Sphingomonas bacterium]
LGHMDEQQPGLADAFQPPPLGAEGEGEAKVAGALVHVADEMDAEQPTPKLARDAFARFLWI